MSSQKKLTFVLINIDPKELDKKYNINIKSNIENNNFSVSGNFTKLSDINSSTQKYFTYLDEAKKHKKCLITMHNYLGHLLPTRTHISCFWCKHPFNHSPIGCPIKYENNIYYTDGIFCSFNCCKAFIHDQEHKEIYAKSDTLLNNLFYSLFNTQNIEVAPTWRILEKFGGNKTIEEFRDSFHKYEYFDIDNYIIQQHKMLPIGHLYEERIKF